MEKPGDSRATPSSGDPDIEQVVAALAADDPTTRREALRTFGRLASEDSDATTAHVEAVGARLHDESLAVARAAADALTPIASERPEALASQSDRLVELLPAETMDRALLGATLLSPLAAACPEAVADHTDRLLEVLAEDEVPAPEIDVPESVETAESRQIIESVQQESQDRRRHIRETAANVVVAITESDPSNLDDIERLETLLDDTDPVVVGAMVDALGIVAQSDPDRVSPAPDSLLDCLDHEVAAIRARTIRTLGYLGAESAVPALETIAAEDDDSTVSELAAETVAFLREA